MDNNSLAHTKLPFTRDYTGNGLTGIYLSSDCQKSQH